jgi:hypothetical protein
VLEKLPSRSGFSLLAKTHSWWGEERRKTISVEMRQIFTDNCRQNFKTVFFFKEEFRICFSDMSFEILVTMATFLDE